ncbi:hypothetical protein EVAR_40863_1 [Eumeta japonica]|uniref:HTH psq-type domain-containing protein n=1 Tax=Eumeta variegata TaxID=151549 RepID=A0A4C1X5Y9_EUMVA|nr:hypothetical protein EVAR_40863_1 [Eumeta japonica]
MVRTYKPKTDRKDIDKESVKDALREGLSKTLSIRKAADKYGIKAATLQHRIEKFRQSFEATRTSTSTHTAYSPPAAAPSVEMVQAESSSLDAELPSSDAASASSSNIYGSKYTVVQVFSK